MCMLLEERYWWAGFNGIYLVRSGFRMWEILIFLKWFLPLKIQINSKKSGFGRKNQLRMWSHLKAYHSIQARFPFIFGCSKNWYIHCKTMFTCWDSLFCNGFTLGPTAPATLIILEIEYCKTHNVPFDSLIIYLFIYLLEISVKSGKDRVSTPSLIINSVRLKKKRAKKYISIQGRVKLRKPPILMVSWVSTCLSFFLSASTTTVLRHRFSLLLPLQLLWFLSNLVH
jgi:hypothetical protein